MKTSQRLITGLALAGALALASTTQAHPGGGFGPGAGYGPGPGAGGGPGQCAGPGGAGGNPVAASEGRLAYLKAELAITAAQEGAWNAFAANARARAQEMQAQRDAIFQSSATAPERLAQRTQLMKQRIAGMEGQAAALKDLYAVLTPEQQKVADGLFAHGPRGRMAFAGWR